MSEGEKKCPRCAEMVKADAYVCRFCGLNFAAGFKPPAPAPTRSKPRFSWVYAVGSIIGLLLIARMAGCGSAPDAYAPSSGPMAATSAGRQASQARRASIKELFDAYEANEMRAQQEYGAQPIIVTGTVRGVDLDLTDDPVVRLEDGEYRLNAYFDKDNGGAATGNLVKGQVVTVQCAEISEVLGTPGIQQCQVIPNSE